MPKCARIGQVIYEDSLIRPALVTFENGNLLPGNEENFSCRIFKDSKGAHVATVASDDMVYAESLSRQDAIYNNFIMTYNKKTRDCKLIAVDSVALKAVPNLKRKSLNVSTGDSKLTTINQLNKKFGSKRTKRQTEQFEKLQVDVSTIQEDLEQTAINTAINENDLVPQAVDENTSEYRPPINKNAVKLEDVYILDDLVSSDLLESLQDKVEEILQDDDKMTVTSFIKREILKVRQSSASDKERKYQLLLYLDCLINMLTTQARLISKSKYAPCSYSDKVSKHILHNFTIVSATGRTRPNSMRDKCMCYILVLSILACNYVINLEDLAKDLKIGLKKLADVAKLLFLTHGKDKNVVMLKLPLPSVSLVASQRKAKRRK